MVRDRVAARFEGELYAPEGRFADSPRCREAGIPGDVKSRTKGGMALATIRRLRREGRRFACIVSSAGYGHPPWLPRALDAGRAAFLAEAHPDRAAYLCDPAPVMPVRRWPARGVASAKGRPVSTAARPMA